MYEPHHTAPGKIQYRTDGKDRIIPTNFVPDPGIGFHMKDSVE